MSAFSVALPQNHIYSISSDQYKNIESLEEANFVISQKPHSFRHKSGDVLVFKILDGSKYTLLSAIILEKPCYIKREYYDRKIANERHISLINWEDMNHRLTTEEIINYHLRFKIDTGNGRLHSLLNNQSNKKFKAAWNEFLAKKIEEEEEVLSKQLQEEEEVLSKQLQEEEEKENFGDPLSIDIAETPEEECSFIHQPEGFEVIKRAYVQYGVDIVEELNKKHQFKQETPYLVPQPKKKIFFSPTSKFQKNFRYKLAKNPGQTTINLHLNFSQNQATAESPSTNPVFKKEESGQNTAVISQTSSSRNAPDFRSPIRELKKGQLAKKESAKVKRHHVIKGVSKLATQVLSLFRKNS